MLTKIELLTSADLGARNEKPAAYEFQLHLTFQKKDKKKILRFKVDNKDDYKAWLDMLGTTIAKRPLQPQPLTIVGILSQIEATKQAVSDCQRSEEFEANLRGSTKEVVGNLLAQTQNLMNVVNADLLTALASRPT